MGIDLLIVLLLLASIYLGYQRGLILAVFSFVSIWIGILLAFKCSALVAGWLGQRVSVSDRWLPILSFVLVLLAVVIVVRLGAKALEGMLELAELGTVNRLAGSLLYLLLTLSLCGALVLGLQWAGVLSEEDSRESLFVRGVQPILLKGFQEAGRWLPGGRDLFESLEKYFRSDSPLPPVS